MRHTRGLPDRDVGRDVTSVRRPGGGMTTGASRPTGRRPRPTDARTLLELQRSAGNRTATAVVQRQALSEQDLRSKCFARSVFERMTEPELEETVDAADRLLLTVTDDAERDGVSTNRKEARREQAVRRYPGFADHRTAVAGAESDRDRRDAVEALVTWSREQLDVYPDLVQRFRRQTQPDVAEKVRVLGVAAAAVARMEFLLGTLLHRGNRWETTGANAGPLVDDYGGGGAAWCTRFATFALAAIRGDSVATGSGYRVANPQEFAGTDLATESEQGGAFVGTRSSRNATRAQNPFVGLRQTLRGITAGTVADLTAEQAAENFMRDHVRPQPGDIVVTRRGDANRNSFATGMLSHTLIVEAVSGSEISLIDGNSGRRTDRVHGRVLDLSDADDVEKIVFVNRPDLTSGVDAAEEALIGTAPGVAGEEVDEQAILRPVQDLNILLEELARSEGDVAQGPSGGTVAEMVGNT